MGKLGLFAPPEEAGMGKFDDPVFIDPSKLSPEELGKL